MGGFCKLHRHKCFRLLVFEKPTTTTLCRVKTMGVKFAYEFPLNDHDLLAELLRYAAHLIEFLSVRWSWSHPHNIPCFWHLPRRAIRGHKIATKTTRLLCYCKPVIPMKSVVSCHDNGTASTTQPALLQS